MKIAVTGGSGQLGTVVLRRLSRDRAVTEIVSIDQRPMATVGAKIRPVTCDVRDPEIRRHFEGCDVVVHLAFVVTKHLPRPIVDSINVGGSRNVFESALAAGARQIVYSSSIAAYGVVVGHPEPIVESTPRHHQPAFAYAATKFEVEAMLDDLERSRPDVVFTRFRPAILVGAHMEHGLGRALKRRVVVDTGGSPAPFVWDEDVADAVALAIEKKTRGAFNLAAADAKPMRELARETGLRCMSAPRGLLRGIAAISPVLQRFGVGEAIDPAWVDSAGARMVISSERARSELGWTPRCPTTTDVVRRFVEVVPARLDPRLALFFGVMRMAGARPGAMPEDVKRLHLRMHLVLTGPGGGDVGLVFEEGRVTVLEGVPRPPTIVVTLKAETLLRMLSGQLDYSTAQMTGKIRAEGEPFAALVLGGIVRAFRERTSKKGPEGFATRKLADWFARGATT